MQGAREHFHNFLTTRNHPPSVSFSLKRYLAEQKYFSRGYGNEAAADVGEFISARFGHAPPVFATEIPHRLEENSTFFSLSLPLTTRERIFSPFPREIVS